MKNSLNLLLLVSDHVIIQSYTSDVEGVGQAEWYSFCLSCGDVYFVAVSSSLAEEALSQNELYWLFCLGLKL